MVPTWRINSLGNRDSGDKVKEVPSHIFLSWDRTQQYEYCAARDEDSAATALDEYWAEFYRLRALMFHKMAHPAVVDQVPTGQLRPHEEGLDYGKDDK